MRSIPVGHWDRFSLFHLGGTLLWQTWLCSEEGGIQDGSRWEEGLHVGGYFHFSRVGWIIWLQHVAEMWQMSVLS